MFAMNGGEAIQVLAFSLILIAVIETIWGKR
jgi:cbb3-type cytochrome oxidase subunit 3